MIVKEKVLKLVLMASTEVPQMEYGPGRELDALMAESRFSEDPMRLVQWLQVSRTTVGAVAQQSETCLSEPRWRA
jgi:hypothetical protein